MRVARAPRTVDVQSTLNQSERLTLNVLVNVESFTHQLTKETRVTDQTIELKKTYCKICMTQCGIVAEVRGIRSCGFVATRSIR